MAAHVIVLANRTAPAREIVEALKQRARRGPIVATLVMPASGPGVAARAAARERLDTALDAWRQAGIEHCDGVVCDPIPLEALSEVWDPMRHDEVIVCTLPGRSSRWVRADLPNSVARYTGVPVHHIVAHDPDEAPRVSAAPLHGTSPMGPLSVLAWGKSASQPESPRHRHAV
jgi:hypothetical protein